MEEILLYSVVLDEDVRVDARTLGKPLAKVLGMTLLETRILIRRGRGLFLEDVTKEQAERAVELLKEQGVGAQAAPTIELPFLPQPRRISLVERMPDALKFRAHGSDDFETWPWDRIHVVSVGAVAMPDYQGLFSNIRFDHMPAFHRMDDTDVRDVLRENLILKLEHGAEEVETSLAPDFDPNVFEGISERWEGKIRLYAEIFPKENDDWLRVMADDFAFIPRAGAVKLGGAWGFVPLLEDLHKHCPDTLSEMTLKLTSQADIKDLVFTQIEEFQRHSTWLVLRKALGKKEECEPSSSPSPEPAESSTEDDSSSSSPAPDTPST